MPYCFACMNRSDPYLRIVVGKKVCTIFGNESFMNNMRGRSVFVGPHRQADADDSRGMQFNCFSVSTMARKPQSSSRTKMW